MTSDPHESTSTSDSASDADQNKPRIKIGSQRAGSPPPRVAPRVKTVFSTPEPESPAAGASAAPPSQAETTIEAKAQADVAGGALAGTSSTSPSDSSAVPSPELLPKPTPLDPGKSIPKAERPPRTAAKIPPPNLRSELPPELAQELEEALGDMSLNELLQSERGGAAPEADELEPASRVRGTVMQVSRDDVFVDLGGHKQGVLPLAQFANPPQVGAPLEVIVARLNADDGLYDLTLPGGAVEIGDWSQVVEGMAVEALITGHNKGGLECEVSHIRGFIPVSQISLFRVEQLEQFVGQRMTCVVTEANPERRNLVLSRRAMLEREQSEARAKLLAELAPGQTREGTVRSLRDFGAFVDLGGVDGLLHVSQISWDRIKHPSDVLKEGQKIRVKIEKVDPQTHKISLNYRDLSENPWTNVAAKYPVTSRVKGTVSKLTDFGAFVRLESGVEGLIHISELAHQRIHRASDVVSEGQEVEVKVLSVDAEAQRISLSLKAFQARPEPAKKAGPETEEPEPPPKPVSKKPKAPLKGGLGRAGGDPFGLKW